MTGAERGLDWISEPAHNPPPRRTHDGVTESREGRRTSCREGKLRHAQQLRKKGTFHSGRHVSCRLSSPSCETEQAGEDKSRFGSPTRARGRHDRVCKPRQRSAALGDSHCLLCCSVIQETTMGCSQSSKVQSEGPADAMEKVTTRVVDSFLCSRSTLHLAVAIMFHSQAVTFLFPYHAQSDDIGF